MADSIPNHVARSHRSLKLEGLNAGQRAAVECTEGPQLVLAGAGTGKTRVITYRMAHLIEKGVSSDRILSVTFTNKASREMAERCQALIGKNLRKKPWISTFHRLCVSVLRQDSAAIGYPNTFSIMDRGDQESIARDVLRQLRVQDTTLKPGDMLSCISRWKSASLGPGAAVDAVENDREYLAAMAYRKYVQAAKASARMDFDDLLALTWELFRDHPEVLRRHQSRFDYVQIDEYQDTNELQFRVIAALVKPHQNLCAVGDDDQSIYGWRGAEVKHILGFKNFFPSANIVRLEENYRCTDQILASANRLIGNNRSRHPKQLRANRFSDKEVRIKAFPDETTEAERVVLEIDYLIKQEGLSVGDFAILFRTNDQPRAFETELRRRKIPYLVIGAQSFFDVREVKDLLAYLRAIAYPKDDNSLLRIINTPPRGIGHSTVEKIVAAGIEHGTKFWETLKSTGVSDTLSPKARSSLERFEEMIQQFRGKFKSKQLSMDQLLGQLIDRIGYREQLPHWYKTPEQLQVKQNLVDGLVSSLKDYCSRAREPKLMEFLDEMALQGRDDALGGEDKSDAEAVKLMTMHSAKGLEFPHVYLVGMEEGLLPHKRSVEATEKEIAEERRVAYVGMTRAQDRLTLTFAESRKKWGKPRKSVPSRFLFEIRQEQKAKATGGDT